MERKRRREPPNLPHGDIDLTPTHEAILSCFNDYRYLTIDLIANLLGKNNFQYTRICILELIAAGYINYYESETPFPLHWPDPLLLNRQSKRLSKKRKLPDLVGTFFLHDFHLSRYVASLHAEAINNDIPFLTKRHFTNHALQLPSSISHTFPDGSRKHSDKPTRPDDLIRIYSSNYAIELERGNPKERTLDLDRASVLRKILCYADIAKKKKYQDLGLTNLRVIFIFDTEAGMKHARDLAFELVGQTNLFLFVHMNYRIGSPVPHLLHAEYERAGLPPTTLYKKGSRD